MANLMRYLQLGHRRESLQTMSEGAGNFRREIISPDGKRKFDIWLFHQVGDKSQPIHSVSFCAKTDGFAWGDILTAERRLTNGVPFVYLYFDFALGQMKGRTYGVQGGYDHYGRLYIEEYEKSRTKWFLLNPDTHEAALYFKREELPPKVDLNKTIEALFEQTKQAELSNDAKNFNRPVLVPFIEEIVQGNAPQLQK